jgi:hypothetical protein
VATNPWRVLRSPRAAKVSLQTDPGEEQRPREADQERGSDFLDGDVAGIVILID